MAGTSRKLLKALGVVTLLTMLAACGGGGGSTASTPTPTGGTPPVSNDPPSNPTPETIEGVATPSSVSVVTATNL